METDSQTWTPIPLGDNSIAIALRNNGTHAKVAERTMTFRTRAPFSRLTDTLHTLVMPPPFQSTVAPAMRLFMRETGATPVEGLVAPVTVADSGGRFAPVVLLVRLNGSSWLEIAAIVKDALERS